MNCTGNRYFIAQCHVCLSAAGLALLIVKVVIKMRKGVPW